MATTVRLSKKFSLQWTDVGRSAIMAGLTSALLVVQQSIDKGDIVFNWKAIAMAAVGGCVGYLLKNFLLEPAKVIVAAPTNEKATEAKVEINKAL